MLKLTASRERLIHKASEQARFASMPNVGDFYVTNDSVVMETFSATLCSELRAKEFPTFKITSNSYRSRDDLAGSTIEVIEPAGPLALEQQVPSRQPGNAISLGGVSREVLLNSMHFTLSLKIRNIKNYEAVLSLGSPSSGRPRKSKAQKRLGIPKNILKHFMNILRRGGCHEALGTARSMMSTRFGPLGRC